jgi:hypothetical protein
LLFRFLFRQCNSAIILQTARVEEEKAAEETASSNNQTTKDDIARLIHLFKDPGAQVHWSNHYGVLNRTQLDVRRTSGPASDAANPLSCLAELFNDYDQFQPQNQMVAYVYDPATRTSKKKARGKPAVMIGIQTYDIEPTNVARRNIYREAAWIKSTWNDVCKYLHQVFVQYNRSGQRSGDMGEWCSVEEQQRWVRAAFWKGGSTNTIVRYPTVMIYSIALLEQADFETIGRLMPTGTGIDNSVAVADAATTLQNKKKRKKRGTYNNKKNSNDSPSNNNAMLRVLQSGTQTESQLSALCLTLQYGIPSEKKKAMKEVNRVAYRSEEATRLESSGEAVESCTGSEDNDDELTSVAEVNDADVNSLSSSD